MHRDPYEAAQLADKRQSATVDATIAEYRRLSPYATTNEHTRHLQMPRMWASLLALSGEVDRMIAVAIKTNPT
jgi:hypothetical protein